MLKRRSTCFDKILSWKLGPLRPWIEKLAKSLGYARIEPPKFQDFSVTPITSPSEDLLGRTHIAIGLADLISYWTQKKSLTASIVGPRGAGKSSLKNLCLYELAEKHGPCIVIDFQPWELSSSSTVMKEFFLEVERKLEKSGAKKAQLPLLLFKRSQDNLKSAERDRELLGAIFTMASAVMASYLTAIKLGLIQGDSPLAQITLWLLLIVMWISIFLNLRWTAWRRRSSELESLTLKEIQSRIVSTLQRTKEKIVIVFDDLDILQHSELRELLYLVQRNASLPHVSFILVFDETPLSESNQNVRLLDESMAIPFRLMHVEADRLKHIFESELTEVLASASIQNFDWKRYQTYFPAGPPPLIGSLRDGRRVLNALAMDMLMLKRSSTLKEVNALDYLLLTIMRIREPAVFELFPIYEAVLTDFGDLNSLNKEIRTSVFEKLKEAASVENRQSAEALMKILFPSLVRPIPNIDVRFKTLSEHEKRKSLCHANFFLRYFLLRLEQGIYSESQIVDQLNAISDQQSFDTQLRKWIDEGSLPIVLARLASKYELIPNTLHTLVIQNLITHFNELWSTPPAIDKVSPTNRVMNRLLAWLRIRSHAEEIIARCLAAMSTKEQRLVALKSAFLASTQLYYPTILCGEWTEREGWKVGDYYNPIELVDKAGLRVLTGICRTRLRAAAKDGSLSEQSDLFTVIEYWQKFDNSKQPLSHLNEQLSSGPGTVKLFQELSQTSEDDEDLDEDEDEEERPKTKPYERSIQKLAKLVGKETVLTAIGRLKRADLNAKEIDLATRALRILKDED